MQSALPPQIELRLDWQGDAHDGKETPVPVTAVVSSILEQVVMAAKVKQETSSENKLASEELLICIRMFPMQALLQPLELLIADKKASAAGLQVLKELQAP